MASTFQVRKASVKRTTVRAGIIAPPGAGKTYGALLFAHGLAGPNGKIVVIDTEGERAENYALTIGFPYEIIPFEPPYSPERYIEALTYAFSLKPAAVIVDQLSHEWNGQGGSLQKVDEKKEQGEKNSFFAWRDVSKAHGRLLETVVGAPCDIIATIRTKVAYEIQDQAGKKVPKRIGLAPIQREGIEYEFDLVLGVDQESHHAEIQKCNAGYHSVVLEALARNPMISTDLGAKISAWRAGLTPTEAPPVSTGNAQAPTSTGNGSTTTPAATTTSSPSTGATSSAVPAATGETPAAEKPKRTRAKKADAAPATTTEAPPKRETPFEGHQLTGTVCATCNEVQRKTPAGPACVNGHVLGNAATASAPPSESAAGSPGTQSGASTTPPADVSGYSVDDSVYDIAGVPTALAADVKATPRDQSVNKKLFATVHGWLVEAVGGKDAAMAEWKDVKVLPGGTTTPTGAQVHNLVFNVAAKKISNPEPATTAGK